MWGPQNQQPEKDIRTTSSVSRFHEEHYATVPPSNETVCGLVIGLDVTLAPSKVKERVCPECFRRWKQRSNVNTFIAALEGIMAREPKKEDPPVDDFHRAVV